jgi:serine protease Do
VIRRLACALVLGLGLAAWLIRGASAQTPSHTTAPDTALPASFARLADIARAAAIVVRALDGDADRTAPDVLDVLGVRRQRTLGAGIIVDPRGIALTSAQAVLLADEFEVVSGDGTPLKAAILGLDRRTDLAVLRLQNDAKVFPYLPLGDSQQLQVGDWVIAVGAPHGLAATVAAGIVTATPAPASPNPLGKFLQTDAVTGLSAGAPLINTRGEVVGLGTGHGDEAVGYVRPSSTVRKVYLDLLENGRVRRPWLGVTTQTLTADVARLLGASDAAGVLITDALPEGPAARALRSGDVVLQLDATRVASRAHLERAVDALTPGHVVRLKFRRAGREMSTSVTLTEEPDESELPPLLARAERLLGIEVRAITPVMGAVAAEVDPSGPAALVGIEVGDVIREVNRRPIRSIADFEVAARELRPGAPVLMLVQRDNVALYVAITTREAGSPSAPPAPRRSAPVITPPRVP